MKNLQLVTWWLFLFIDSWIVGDVHSSATKEPVASIEEATSTNSGGEEWAGNDSERIIYDQRQSGKYNIHISIKDVAIIEMNQNEVDEDFDAEDYYYDDGDLTINPLPWLKNQTTTAITPTTSATSTTSMLQTTANSTHTLIPLSTTPLTANGASTAIANTSPAVTTYSANLLADIAATEAGYANSDKNVADTHTTTTTINTNTKKTPNVVILATNAPLHDSPTSTHKLPMSVTELMGRNKDVPRKTAISPSAFDSVLLPPARLHYKTLKNVATRSQPLAATVPLQQKLGTPPQQEQLLELQAQHTQATIGAEATITPSPQVEDSKIYKLKMRRAHKDIRSRAGTAARPHPRARAPCHQNYYQDTNGNCRSRRASSSPSILKRLFHMLLSLPLAAAEHEHERDFGGDE